ncbi:hypothetical protein BC829DRAFT_404678 [Chytridium lagenaria]|nr:hypothetical protein BC829DRAFT_404678 [Chytridium lagenaria]
MMGMGMKGSVDVVDCNGDTALHCACRGGDEDVVGVLKKSGGGTPASLVIAWEKRRRGEKKRIKEEMGEEWRVWGAVRKRIRGDVKIKDAVMEEVVVEETENVVEEIIEETDNIVGETDNSMEGDVEQTDNVEEVDNGNQISWPTQTGNLDTLVEALKVRSLDSLVEALEMNVNSISSRPYTGIFHPHIPAQLAPDRTPAPPQVPDRMSLELVAAAAAETCGGRGE